MTLHSVYRLTLLKSVTRVFRCRDLCFSCSLPFSKYVFFVLSHTLLSTQSLENSSFLYLKRNTYFPRDLQSQRLRRVMILHVDVTTRCNQCDLRVSDVSSQNTLRNGVYLCAKSWDYSRISN